MTNLQKIKEKLNIIEFASKRWQAKELSSNKFRINPCPICGHKDCFTLFAKTQSFYCFSCGSGGDILNLAVLTGESSSYYGAIEKFAGELGIELKKGTKKEIDQYRSLQKLFSKAAEFYHNNLTVQSKNYLIKKRKRTEKFIMQEKYGTANGKSLYDHLIKKGFKQSHILQSGLIRKNDDGNIYDLFNENVLIYPVSVFGKVSDFFCKDPFPKDKKEKKEYQLPKNSKLNNVLFYGQDSIYSKEFILVEGPEDRNTIIQNHKFPAAAILGQLSEDQITFLLNNASSSTIYLAFDPDEAGRKYTEKILKNLSGKAYLKRLIWPGEIDIDDYIKQQSDPNKAIKELIENSKDAIIYEIEQLQYIKDMDPRAADIVLKPIFKYIANEQSEYIRNRYIDALGEKLALKIDGSPGTKSEVNKYLPMIKSYVNKLLGIDTTVGAQAREKPESGIFEQYGRYYYIADSKTLKISNFILRITQYIEEEEDILYEVQLRNDKGVYSQKFILDAEDRVNFRKFKVACARKGQFHYFGNDQYLSEIFQREENSVKDVPITCYFQRYGWIPKHKLWLFHNCVIQNNKIYRADDDGVTRIGGVGYVSKNVNIYSNDKPVINIDEKITQEYINEILIHFWTMWDHREEEIVLNSKKKGEHYKTFKGFISCAYIAAMAYRSEWIKNNRMFPNLFGYGPVQTGKSYAIQLMMNAMGWHYEGNMWGSSSVVGITYSLEHLSNLPLWMEEYTNSRSKDPKQEKKVELVRGAYNMSSPVKGSINRQIVANEVNTNFVLTGQDFFNDKAAQTRTIGVRKEKPSIEGTNSYFHLKSQSAKLSGIFRWLLQNKTPEKIKELYENFEKSKQILKRLVKKKGYDAEDRILINYSIIIASFAQFNFHLYDQEFMGWIADEIIGARKLQVEADIVNKFFEDIPVIFYDSMSSVVKFEFNTDYQGDVVYLWFHRIYHEWAKDSARLAQGEYLSESILRDYLKRDPAGYWVEPKNSRRYFPDGSERRCVWLLVNKLPDNLKEIVESWGTRDSQTEIS